MAEIRMQYWYTCYEEFDNTIADKAIEITEACLKYLRRILSESLQKVSYPVRAGHKMDCVNCRETREMPDNRWLSWNEPTIHLINQPEPCAAELNMDREMKAIRTTRLIHCVGLNLFCVRLILFKCLLRNKFNAGYS